VIVRKRGASTLVLFTLLVLSACAPGPSSSGGQVGSTQRDQVSSQPQRTLTLVAAAEPQAATPRVDQSGGFTADISQRLFVAGLAYPDERGVPQPYLAEALPQLNTESWKVSPDGSMDTTYVLRRGLTWHDGTPLTAHDFVFAERLYRDPQVSALFKPTVQSFLNDVEAVDDRTVVFHWNKPYALAAQLDSGKQSFHPMPRHLLEAAFDSDPGRMANHPYWTTDFVGTGPYKLVRWEAGSFIDGAAFDGHALGRPKIDRIQMRWISDPNTALANLLAGNVDLVADGALNFQQAAILQRDWVPQSKGQVILNTSQVRYVQIQARPEFANPASIRDLRVRQALSFAADRQAIVDGVLDGQGQVADTLVSPDTSYYSELDKVLAKYPHDPRRAEALLGQVGYTRGADGFFTSPALGRLSPEVRGTQQNETAILVDAWRRIGVDAQLSVTPASLANDQKYRAEFPACAITNSQMQETTAVQKYATDVIAAPENRYGGTNKGGYSNPEYDRFLEGFNAALARDDRNYYTIQIMRVASEQVPGIPLYYQLEPTAYVATLQGPLKSTPGALNYWNIHDWTWKQG
jgi:peptide/nickel transport system substrate-binding protein